jgi:predicted lipoprotein
MKRISLIVLVVGMLAILSWRFPLFHIVPLMKASEQRSQANFNAAEFVRTFWTDRLLNSLDKATKADVLLPLIQSDPTAARKRYSRSLGLSDSYTYFVSGTGRIVAVSDSQIALVVTEGSPKPQVVLEVGLIFGNVVRDAPGLLDVNDYPSSQDFNAISQELNRIIETSVLPRLRGRAKVGAIVRFVGCAEVDDPAADLSPLRIVPIQAEIEP